MNADKIKAETARWPPEFRDRMVTSLLGLQTRGGEVEYNRALYEIAVAIDPELTKRLT